MILRALVEIWPNENMIYIHELPGAVVGRETLAAALRDLPDAVEGHLNWIATHGFDVRPFAGADVDVAEELEAVEGRRGPLFDADREPPSTEHIEWTLSVASIARRDLIDLYRSVSALRRERAPATEEWSIADHLRHIAESEMFYASNLGKDTPVPLPADPVAALQASAGYAEKTLRSLDETDRVRVHEHGGEAWTSTKVLRRMSGHLREHYPWVRELAHN